MGIAINELTDLELVCLPGEKCTYTNGEQIMKERGYDEYTIPFCAGILVVYIVGCRIVSYCALRFYSK